MRIGGILAAGMLLSSAYAADLGTAGTTYDITESDARAWVMRLISELDADALKEKYLSQIENYDTTLPQYESTAASETRTRIVDMSMTLDRDIIAPVPNDDGTVTNHYLGRKGDVINPLDHVVPKEGFLFIDGEDEAQVEFMLAALEHDPHLIMPVLVKGRSIKMAERFDRPIFHVLPVMVERFGIEHTPALAKAVPGHVEVTEFGRPLEIEELHAIWVPLVTSQDSSPCTEEDCEKP